MGIFEKGLLRYWEFIRKMDAKRLSKQSDPEKVTVISDIPYIKDAERPNYLDIYYPEGTDKALPTIIDIHGGGWMYGNKELNKKYCMHLATRGFTVVNINYHLVQEKRFPRQLQDIFAALNWVYDNAKDYYIDLNRVFLTGDSAGGHLASMTMALMYNDEVKKLLNIDTKIDIKAGGLTCGVYDFDKYKFPKKTIFSSYKNVILGEKFKGSKYGNILTFNDVYTGKMPPLYLVSSKEDIIGEQTLNFAKYCEEKGINHTLRFYDKGKTNKLIHVFPITFPLYEESVAVNDEMCKFFLSAVE